MTNLKNIMKKLITIETLLMKMEKKNIKLIMILLWRREMKIVYLCLNMNRLLHYLNLNL